MTKVITLTGLKQADELSHHSECTPVEDAMVSGSKIIRCKEDVVELERSAPEKVATLSGVSMKKPRRKRTTGHKMGSVDKPCVPEWVAMRSRGGRQIKRCHCKNGRFITAARCSSRKD